MKKFSTLTAIFAMLFSASAIAQDFPSDPGTVLVDLETVAVDSSNGDSISGQAPTGAGSYTLGDTVTVTAREIQGYTFQQWDDQSTDNPRKVVMDQSKSVTALYSHDKYVIMFLNANNDTIVANEYYYGEEVSTPEAPEQQPTEQYTFTFAGWNPEITEVTGDQTYRPVYDTIVNSYAITFYDYDSITVLKRDTVDYGQMPTPPADPTRETADGVIYTFVGWAPTIAAVTGETNYYAQFSTEDIIYKVVFTMNFTDGKTPITDTISTTYNGEAILNIEIPDGYHFIGWADGYEDIYPRTVAGIVSDTSFVANAGPSYIDIEVAANAWTFFCLPEIMIGDGWQSEMLITDSLAGVAWGTYDGARRASAQSGWVTPEEYFATQGYIIYSTKAGVLRLNAYPEQVTTDEVTVALQTYEAAHEQNANWNFIGNPYNVAIAASNIEVSSDTELSATIWNGTGYDNELLSSATLAFEPLQAFFVQGAGEGQITFTQSGNPAPRRAQAVVPENSRIDIQATAGGYTDKARVIFRSNSSIRYEAGRDASKFITATAPVQMYFIDVDNVECAQMVRPAGEDNIRLGYMLRNAGELTIEMPVYANDYELYDVLTNNSYNLNETVTVYSDKGTFNNRFELRPIKKVVTAIEDNSTVAGTAKLFINGQLYLIRDGKTFTVQGIETK
ncbi:MAG: InlB B-repeat-containing protein [Paludibacteraceae bacterium]|nr:InlB B-repeat-containing protein [Paludibacteraceae bacterium]